MDLTEQARPPTAQEISDFRAHQRALLTQAAQALTQAAQAHEEFRTTRWLPTPRRRRGPLAPQKDALAQALTQARAHRDAVLTDPATLLALTAAERERATGLSRQGRRDIERAHQVPPTHPAYAPPPATPTTPTPATAPEGALTS